MCAQFEVDKIKFQKSLAIFALDLSRNKINARIFPHTTAPVIIHDKNKNKYKIKSYNFSLVPVWSKDRKPKFSTHNVRLETVLEKPTWKRPFLKNHCLVPISTFIEPIYEGKFAGNMVKFVLNECVFIPAICDHWTDPKTNKIIHSFSILTSEPGKFVKKVGHERSPIFIKQNIRIFDSWFDFEKNDGDSFIELLDKRYEPKMSAIIDRPLKKGWEKRI
jgi:putative SOS response-associated peptidase YedK